MFFLFDVYHTHAWFLQRSEKGTRSSVTGIIDDSESPWGCQYPNLNSLEKQPILLTTELPFQPLKGHV